MNILFSVCLTIGAYSKWLDASTNGISILPSLVENLMSGMSTSEDTAAAAALAFRHICDGMFHVRGNLDLLLCFV